MDESKNQVPPLGPIPSPDAATAAQLAQIRQFVTGNADTPPTKPRVRVKMTTSANPTPPPTESTAKAASTEEPAPVKAPDPVAFGQALWQLAERSQPHLQKIWDKWLEQVRLEPAELPAGTQGMTQLWLETLTNLANDPKKVVNWQLAWWQDYMKLCSATARRLLGKSYQPIIQAAPGDKRFTDAAWSENTTFDFIKQSYLLTARWLQQATHELEGVEPKQKKKLEFYTRQFVDAVAPTNFFLTNPTVLRTTAETGGENLIKGLENLIGDLERGEGQLRISMTDMSAFRLGENIATTPGAVVYENELMQLIHYLPQTPQQHAAPLLIIPPWINKYYILDLTEQKSFVRYALQQGHSVFMVSWVNPDSQHRNIGFDDYMVKGLVAALQAVQASTGCASVNIIGYCLGGTLLASLLAWLAAQPNPPPLPVINSATYLVTLVDFAEPGDIGVFVDEEQLTQIEQALANKGYMEASLMANTFNLLRANDLIWSFVVNNYMLGKEPFPFDLLFWNSDSTRMPAKMYQFYLRQLYMENKLVQPGGVVLTGVPLDLRRINTPCLIVGTREDHITPWRSTYAATQLYAGEKKYILAGSGHIAGIINPPAQQKYSYWEAEGTPTNPDDWLASAQETKGSWWQAWAEWIKPHAGEPVAPYVPGTQLPIIEPAPGRYVRVRA